MPLDGSMVLALKTELEKEVLNHRIDKIHQPEADEIIVITRGQGQNKKILLSAHSKYPRIHITNLTKTNPATPPMFCMLLRKHLIGNRIIGIYQPSLERIIELEMEGTDELNQLSKKRLIIEMMGKHSNIILVDNQNQNIMDSIKRIPIHISSKRQILPGLPYQYPPSDKLNPFGVRDFSEWLHAMQSSQGRSLEKDLLTIFAGISPSLAKELCYKASLDSERLFNTLMDNEKEALYLSFAKWVGLLQQKNLIPITYQNDSGHYQDIASFPMEHVGYPHHLVFDTFSQMLEEYYRIRDEHQRLQQKSQDLRKNMTIKRNRTAQRLQNLNNDLEKARKASEDKIKADLIMSNLHHIQQGQDFLETYNYFDEKQPLIKIPLNKAKTPAQNAQKFYKRYQKSKKANIEIKRQIKKTHRELEYLDQVLLFIEQAESLQDLEEVRHELVEAGYIKRKSVGKKSKLSGKTQESGILHFQTEEGIDLYVGKNNYQNEKVTFGIAGKNDLWFHVKDFPGSHVILKSGQKDPSDEILKTAAILAAYYSKGKMGQNVAVDYTRCRHVRKQRGNQPGMVIYDHHQTLYVTPDESIIDQLKKQRP
ncbi:MAG: fibronectin/fibrinogen-binding protein [Tindallia sp. MSAO_Bac2]|nr:MAG: fibronectin/fibrinogen-binding protein [Tindallia sp. MSAO_Bac2]